MENYKVLKVNGKEHILKPSMRMFAAHTNLYGHRIEAIPQANYRGTGMCLCGVLKKDQSLEQFIEQKHKS